MKSVVSIADEIIAREGGFVNDPDDPGGPTNFGVTIHTMRRLGIDVDGDGDVDVSDVRGLKRAQARDIFIQHYFFEPRLNLLPEGLQPSVFDMYVNAGGNAIRILQRFLRGIGFDLHVDGVLGPETLAAVRIADQMDREHLIYGYSVARRDYYFRLADRRPQSRKYARTRSGRKGGWIRRAEEFLPESLHLSEAQFAERTAAWD